MSFIEQTTRSEGWLQLDPVSIPNSEGVLLDGSALLTLSDYEIWFNVVNVDGTNSVDVSLGVDIGAGGSLADPEYWMFEHPVAGGAETGWTLGGIIGPDDDVRGVASAADDAAVHFRARRIYG